jgi:nitrogen-specific signal transduction histidine kinase
MNAIEAHTPSLAPKFAHLVLNALPHPVLMIESDDRIADADVAAEDFLKCRSRFCVATCCVI